MNLCGSSSLTPPSGRGGTNPNVFQICMLKPQTESEIRSRQEIGRGLRLCVNQEGERMDESVLGGAVQELNKLTLITDMEFGRFAEALQQGLAASLAGRPRMVEPGLFAGRLLTGTTGARVRVTRELAEEICAALRKQGYMKDRVLTGSFFADRDRGAVRLGGSLQDLSAAVAQVLSGVYTPRAIPAENAHGGNVTARRTRRSCRPRRSAPFGRGSAPSPSTPSPLTPGS